MFNQSANTKNIKKDSENVSQGFTVGLVPVNAFSSKFFFFIILDSISLEISYGNSYFL